jgi:rRNA-processing protein FCF1
MRASENKPVKVILDTNFLFIPLHFKVDIFEELFNLLKKQFDPILLSSTQKELQGLAKSSSPKISKQALMALQLSEKCRFVNIDKSLSESYDDVIVRIALDWNSPVCTNDRELRNRLRKKGAPVIFLRQKQRLEMEGAV